MDFLLPLFFHLSIQTKFVECVTNNSTVDILLTELLLQNYLMLASLINAVIAWLVSWEALLILFLDDEMDNGLQNFQSL